jgi:hypothetical protein
LEEALRLIERQKVEEEMVQQLQQRHKVEERTLRALSSSIESSLSP